MSSVHLLALVHGMWGNPAHLAEMRRIIMDTYSAPVDGMELQVLVAETNRDDSTYDGIDWGAERVSQEVCRPGSPDTHLLTLHGRFSIKSKSSRALGSKSSVYPLQAIVLVDLLGAMLLGKPIRLSLPHRT